MKENQKEENVIYIDFSTLDLSLIVDDLEDDEAALWNVKPENERKIGKRKNSKERRER